jgi:predicted ATPase/DNA-binding winged helix-turn-helix (wHTH) protein
MDDRDSIQATDGASFGPFHLFAAERLLQKGDEPLPLGGRALDILIALVERAGEVVTHRELLARVWPDVTVEEANLRVHIAGLRKALGDGQEGARYVANVPGRGYSFVAPVARATGRRSSPVPVPRADRLERLPARLTRMVGRDNAVRALSAQLMKWRFVSIVGPGGIGKTTVAVAVAYALLDAFNGSAFFVDLGALSDPQLVPAAVASTLGFTMGGQDPFHSLPAFLGDSKVLLLLDNCEHVIDVAAPMAERIASQAPQTHILATGREALRAEGEHVHLLYSLDNPPGDSGLTAVEALKYPAAQLFMERAAASGYRSELSDADAPIVARICRRLDGIALAIELAASRVGSNGIRGTAELFDNRFGLLWHGRRTALPRHRTLTTMLDWSYNLLSDSEKTVLRRLSVFAGDFTLEGACSIGSEVDPDGADVANAVASLVSKSLIATTAINGPTVFRLLDTTRTYAAAKLAEHGEADRVARRLAKFYSNFLQHDKVVQSRYGEHDLSGYAQHIGNVRAALEWALSDQGDAAVGVDLAAWAAPLFVGLSLLEECKRWCERALAALDDASRGTKQEMILQEAAALSSMFTKGDSGEVRRGIERGLSIAEALGDQLHQLQLLYGMNIFLTRLGDFRGALAAVEQAGDIARNADDPIGIIMTEWMLGASHHLIGNQAAAQLYCETGMTHMAAFGTVNTHFFGFDHRICALVVLARALWLRGLSDRALQTAQMTIDEAVRRDDPVLVSFSLSYCAPVFLWAGDLERAGELIERLIAHAARHSLSPYEAIGIGLKGELAVGRDEPEAGLPLLRSALGILHKVQHNVLVTGFTGVLAESLEKIGQVEEALLTINGAIAGAKHCGATFDLAELLRIKASILAAIPQHGYAPAVDCLREALAVAREQSALTLELRSASAMARLLAANGRRDEARQTLAPVLARFGEGFETADLRAARRLVKDVA